MKKERGSVTKWRFTSPISRKKKRGTAKLTRKDDDLACKGRMEVPAFDLALGSNWGEGKEKGREGNEEFLGGLNRVRKMAFQLKNGNRREKSTGRISSRFPSNGSDAANRTRKKKKGNISVLTSLS